MINLVLITGLFFLSIGTLGLLRLPGALNRMHATSVATTLGTGFILLAGTLQFYPENASFQAILTIVFLFITAPTGAHLIARAHERKNSERGKTLKEFL